MRVLLILFMVSLSTNGCGTASRPVVEPVTLIFSFPENDNEFYESLVPVFNQDHPNITINLNALPSNVLNRLDPGQTDVIAAGVYYLRELQQKDGILGLNSVIEKDDYFNMSDYLPGTVDFLSLDGETWALPVGADLDVMYFNKDLFNQHNLPYPEPGWNWDDFLTYALLINDPEIDKVYGYTTKPGYQDVYSFIYQHGGSLFNDMLYPTEPTFNNPQTVEAVEFFADLFHRHGVAPTPAKARRDFGGSQYAFYDAIRRGNIGMWSMPISQRGGTSWPVEWLINWGIVPLPRGIYSFAPFWVEEGFAISSETSNPDECWLWLNFLSRQVNPRLLPARRSLVQSPAYKDLVGDEVSAVVEQSLEFAVPVSIWQWINQGNAINIFNQAIEDVVEGNSSPQEALDWAQERAKSQMP